VFRFQVSGVRCQQLKSTHWIGVAHEIDFVSPELAFSRNPISVQDSIFPDTGNLEQIGPMAEPIISDLAHRTRFSMLEK